MLDAVIKSNSTSVFCQDHFSDGIDFQNTLAAGDLPASKENIAFYHTHFWKEVGRRHELLKKKNIAKILLRERMTGKSFADQEAKPPYLEYNAQTTGDADFAYIENLPNVCDSTAIWFEGAESGAVYVKKVHCRKQWCPVCGGKDGVIHKSRLHSVLKRVDVQKYNLRQFVFPLPAECRELCQTKEGLNKLFRIVRSVIEKFFGVPVFDKKGHVKGYKMELPCISYLHVFGDEETGVFKPHINVHIFEKKSEKLKLSQGMINSIRNAWGKKLQKMDVSINPDKVDFFYSFASDAGKVLHRIKYMIRPWNKAHYDSAPQEIKELLVKDLLGFQYFRYWGALANCKYKDEMEIDDIIEEIKSKADEPLITRMRSDFDFNSWASKLEEIDEGFYRLKDRRYFDEWTKGKDATAWSDLSPAVFVLRGIYTC